MEESTSSTTSPTAVPESSSGSVVPAQPTQFSAAELLLSQFLKNISKPQELPRKYPNPEVPEFYPRNMKIVYTDVTRHSDENTQASCTTIDTNENELLVTRMSQECYATDVAVDCSPKVNDSQYYLFDQPNLTAYMGHVEPIPRSVNFRRTMNFPFLSRKAILNRQEPLRSTKELQIELNVKNQQLAHMNNVVRALLEEIWKINELLTKNKNHEQDTHIDFAVLQYLKSASEFGFHCEDCCNQLKEFVIRISRQLERRMVKQLVQYKNNFVDCVISVIENSLQLLKPTKVDEIRSKLRLQDASTQTDLPFANSFVPARMDPYRQRQGQQTTRVYRNRNFYRYSIPNSTVSNWCQGTIQETRPPWRNTSYLPRVRWSARPAFDGQNWKNPIQLIHQRFKNLNCRLEGMPDENLVKFSYIVNGKEYSAVASTKKEAQYHCAWHVLNSFNEN